ncbi:MAG: efflux RND transporter permease subunit, partial [Candidatus Hydrogenedentota bacterium]
MNLTELAIRRSRVTVALVIVAVAGGTYALYSLPRAEDPGFTIRTALVLTYLPGANPRRMELLVTEELEQAFTEMPEVMEIRSESRRGVSIIEVEVHHYYDELEQIWDELRHKIEKRRENLPENVIGPIVNDDFGDVYGIVIGLTGEGAGPAELHDIAERLEDEVLLLNDAGKANIHGVQEERIFIEFDTERLAYYGLSPGILRELLAAVNLIAPGGDVRIGEQRIVLEPTGDFVDLEDLRKTVVFLPNDGSTVFLENIAHISRGYADPPKTKVRTSRGEGLALAISLREDGNIIRLGEDVRKLLQVWRERYPLDIQFEIIAFQPDAVDDKIDAFLSNVLQSVAIVCVVMLLFLGIRVGLVVATLIPTAMLATFTIMRISGIGLDQVSLASLIIALGMLVDNAVVVSEATMVYMGEGLSPLEAAGRAGRELWAPLLTSSLTTAAGFLPIFL